eukprot:138396_1
MGGDFCNCNLPKPQESNLDQAMVMEEKRKIVQKNHRNVNVNPEEKSEHKTNEEANHAANQLPNVAKNERKQSNYLEEEDGEPSHSNNNNLIHPIDVDISISINSNTNASELYFDDHIHHSNSLFANWSEESLEWYKIDKMNQLCQFINYYQRTHFQLKTHKKHPIWSRFDVNNTNKLKTKKYLPQLLYSYCYLLLKSKNFNSKPPKFRQL